MYPGCTVRLPNHALQLPAPWLQDHPADKVIRLTDRPNLFVVLGDKKATAQILLGVQRSPISFTYDKLIPSARAEKYDYVIIDTSPSVGELQEQALWAADGVLIPCAVYYLASDGVFNIAVTLKRIHDESNWRGAIMGILPTFYDDVTRESKATLGDLQKRFGKLLLSPVHRATILRECAVEGKTIFELDPMQYSALKQINKSNVAKLKLAWLHPAPGPSGRFSFNPLVVDGVLYVVGRDNAIVALDATNSHRGVGCTQVVKPPFVMRYFDGPSFSMVSP